MKKINEIPQKISIWGLISIFLINFGYMADLAIIPAADTIFGTFIGTVPIAVLNFILTGPQLIAVFAALLATVFMRYFSKKNLIIFFFGLFVVCGCFGAIIENAYYIAFMRALVGFAEGSLFPVGIALINEVYHDNEKLCSRYVGFYNGCGPLTGALMSIVAGMLCVISWTSVFKIYWFGIPVLILMIFTIPRTPPEKVSNPKTDEKTNQVKDKLFTGRVIALLASFLLINLLFTLMTYCNSIYLAETGLGDASVSGIATCIGTLSAAFAGFIFSLLYGKMKRGMIILSFALMSLSFLGACFVLNPVWFIVCMIVGSIGYGTAIPYYFMYITVVAPPSRISACMGLVTAVMGAGTALCSYVLSFLEKCGFPDMLSVCPYYAAVFAAGGILSVILTVRNKKLGLDQDKADIVP